MRSAVDIWGLLSPLLQARLRLRNQFRAFGERKLGLWVRAPSVETRQGRHRSLWKVRIGGSVGGCSMDTGLRPTSAQVYCIETFRRLAKVIGKTVMKVYMCPTVRQPDPQTTYRSSFCSLIPQPYTVEPPESITRMGLLHAEGIHFCVRQR